MSKVMELKLVLRWWHLQCAYKMHGPNNQSAPTHEIQKQSGLETPTGAICTNLRCHRLLPADLPSPVRMADFLDGEKRYICFKKIVIMRVWLSESNWRKQHILVTTHKSTTKPTHKLLKHINPNKPVDISRLFYLLVRHDTYCTYAEIVIRIQEWCTGV